MPNIVPSDAVTLGDIINTVNALDAEGPSNNPLWWSSVINVTLIVVLKWELFTRPGASTDEM